MATPVPDARDSASSGHSSRAANFPVQPFEHLDELWIQIGGTLCNLTCSHCFVSAGPGNRRQPLMSREEVRARVAESVALGVRELYFTGGEPFLHPELLDILADSLRHAPCTVLTNGTRFAPPLLEGLRRLALSSPYSLELRVSLDGHDAEANDSIRGRGVFARVIAGLRECERFGFHPIVTATHGEGDDPARLAGRYLDVLRAHGIRRPRLKLIPLFRFGREAERDRPYAAGESLADWPREAFDPSRLQCAHSRAVSALGVHVCPLLVDEPEGRMGDRLAEALRPITLSHRACYTCQMSGMTCGN